MLPYQWDALNDRIPGAEPSCAVQNFQIAAGLAQGEFQGEVFQDSDVAKWLEAAAYLLAAGPDPELEAVATDDRDYRKGAAARWIFRYLLHHKGA